MQRSVLLAALTTLVGAATGCGPTGANRVDVEMTTLVFTPDPVTVTVGDTVVWINRDLVPHTVSADGTANSGMVLGGESYTFVATTPGDIDYVCDYHPTMKGTLRVEAR